MIERLRKAIEHVNDLPEADQEDLANIIDEMWQMNQLQPFNPAEVPNDGNFEEEMRELDRIRSKPMQVAGN